jgi:periplasmic mercuric ion binding protein
MNTPTFLRPVLLAATLAWAGPVLAQEARTVKLSVNGMVCSFCAQGIEKRLTKMPETGPLYINLAQKVVLVEPKAGQRIDIDKVRAEITDAGYDVTAVETLAKPVAALRAELKAKK